MFLREKLFDVSDDDVDTERSGASLDDCDRLRQDTPIHEESLALLAKMPESHDHSFSGGSSLVEEGRVGNGETRQRGRESLEIDEGFEATLRNLGLDEASIRFRSRCRTRG